jgi:histidinol-phosphatase
MVAAASGLGCWWNGRRVHVSKVNKLNQAYFCCTDVASFRKNGRAEVYDRVAKAVYFRPGWGDAYGYACVATGRAEIMMDPVMNVWDCGPFPPIFRETGGYFGDWQGNETIYSCEALATNQALLPEILEIINS